MDKICWRYFCVIWRHRNRFFNVLHTLTIDPLTIYDWNRTRPNITFIIMRIKIEFITTIFGKLFSVPLYKIKNCATLIHKSIQFFFLTLYRKRALNICSTSSLLKNELNFLKAIALDRGYSITIIDAAIDKFQSYTQNNKKKKNLKFSNRIVCFLP